MSKVATSLIGASIKWLCIIGSFAINAIVFWMHEAWIMFAISVLMILVSLVLYCMILCDIQQKGFQEDRR